MLLGLFVGWAALAYRLFAAPSGDGPGDLLASLAAPALSLPAIPPGMVHPVA